MPSLSCQITTITFDADETLWAFDAAQRRAFQCALIEMQALVPATAGIDASDLRRIQATFVASADPRASWEARRLDAFRRTLARFDAADDTLAQRLTATYLRVRYDSIELFDDVDPVLATLRPGYTLGIISNGNTRAGRCGCPDLFDLELYAEDFDGVSKPGRRMFDAAMAASACSPRELLHVGDSLANDVAGALGVGAAAVWLNRAARPRASAVVPTHEIRSLTELPALLGVPHLATDGSTP